MARFEDAYQATLANEGGYQNNPADAGNMPTLGTYKGIAPRFWPTWRGWEHIKRAIASMTMQPHYGTESYRRWVKTLNATLAEMSGLQNLVRSFYRSNFWDQYHLEGIVSQQVAEWVFDHVVNGGTAGIRWIQRASGVNPDGIMGSVTLLAINSADPDELLMKAREVAKDHRLSVVARKPDQKQFLTSWLRRDGYSDAEIKEIIA